MTPDQTAIYGHIESLKAVCQTQIDTHTFVAGIDKDGLRDAQALLQEGFRIWLKAIDPAPTLKAVK